jgi:hypothetical protein
VKAFAKVSLPTCAAGEVIKSDGTNLSCVSGGGTLTGDVSGTSTANTVDKIKGKPVTAPSVPGQFLVYDGTGYVPAAMSGDATMTTAGAVSLPTVGTSGIYYKVTTDSKGRVTSGSASLSQSDIPTLTNAGKVDGSAVSGTLSNSSFSNMSGFVQAGSVATRQMQLWEPTLTKAVLLAAPGSFPASYQLNFPQALPTISGQILSSDTSGNMSWANARASGVTSVMGTTPITIGGTAAAPNVSIAMATTVSAGAVTLASIGGTTASTAVQASDGRMADSRTPMGTASGDLSSNYPAPTVSKINGKTLSYGTFATGQVLQYDGTNWVNTTLSSANLTDGASLLKPSSFPANCSANQTLTFSSPTGVWTCSNIGSLDGSVITGGTVPLARLPASVQAWAPVTGGINYSGGNVGIGNTAPAAKLDVTGEVKFGNSASFCSGTTEGQQRYNSTTHSMEFCNGTAWMAYGAPTFTMGKCGFSGDPSQTPASFICTGVPASTSVSVSCSGDSAFSPSSITLSCRASGVANQIYCNTSAPQGSTLSFTCLWAI